MSFVQEQTRLYLEYLVFKLVDDILTVGDNVIQLLDRIKAVFKRCLDHGITLSNTKFQVGFKVKFAGYVVSNKGKEPDPDKIAAIAQFPRPDNLTDVRSFISQPILRTFHLT